MISMSVVFVYILSLPEEGDKISILQFLRSGSSTNDNLTFPSKMANATCSSSLSVVGKQLVLPASDETMSHLAECVHFKPVGENMPCFLFFLPHFKSSLPSHFSFLLKSRSGIAMQ